ncbi:MAG: hypothetical protein ACE5IH_10395 [Thermodesulfobacteriota bacterium]
MKKAVVKAVRAVRILCFQGVIESQSGKVSGKGGKEAVRSGKVYRFPYRFDWL